MRILRGAGENLLRTGLRFWHLGSRKALALLQATWNHFSQPVPASRGQLLTQFLLCGVLAAAAAGLIHHWLVSSLHCPPGPSAMAAAACGLLVALGLGLVAPVRCLFALSVPTVGTEQGRRLLLSYSTVTLATTAVPNVLSNVRAAGRVLRCVTEGSLENLLNTTRQLEEASRVLDSAHQAGARRLTLETQGSGSAFRLHMLRVTKQVLEDFSDLEARARATALGAQRVVTGLLVLGLLVESAWYLHRYLTDLHFDNVYVTRQLAGQLAEAQATHLVASPPAWLLHTTRPRLSPEELLHCLLRLGLLALLLVVTATTVATDHVAFLLAQAAVDWAQKLSSVPIKLTIKYDSSYTLLDFIHFLFNQPPPETPFVSAHSSYQWELHFVSPGCQLLPAQCPHTAASLAAGTLQLLACVTVLLETYARRLRHAIAASFFTSQETRRVRHLRSRLQRRYDRHCCQQPFPAPEWEANAMPTRTLQKEQGTVGRDVEPHAPECSSWPLCCVTLERSLHLSEPVSTSA
ncbi:PREDICTED: osteoclast stimulatory transmembrane protein [Elephantulus edwardii]|uniref:osteoclast stimulatory transmembrane protein n=1 Tax=Elephantulus edwardii TaxID=28737 RepID=UPI0003F07BAD|nr:PREDICTED: osteoclast stimulatory transmembrane protein [Elephantulus edwardii]